MIFGWKDFRAPIVSDRQSETQAYSGGQWFFIHYDSRDTRPKNCGKGSPQGILPNSTKEERIEACTNMMNYKRFDTVF